MLKVFIFYQSDQSYFFDFISTYLPRNIRVYDKKLLKNTSNFYYYLDLLIGIISNKKYHLS